MHPLHPEALQHLKALDFFRLENFRTVGFSTPELPSYLPQIRFRTALKGHLKEDVYGIRAKEIVGKRKIKKANEVRDALGLESDQLLVVLLFDEDGVIERLSEDFRRVKALAEAGFDLIVSASFSVWRPRPRFHNLRNLFRSVDLCIALQKLGGNAIPRLDWELEFDVYRWGKWLKRNPNIEMIAVDAMTCATNGWDEVVEGLDLLDQLSGRRLRYLVNGPSIETRWAELFAIVPADRLCLTEAGPISAAPSPEEQLQFGSDYRKAFGPRFSARVLRKHAAVAEAAARAA